MATPRLLEVLEPVSVTGTLPETVGGLATDSRRVRPGDWFFALPGQHVEGARFAEAARAAGATCVVAEAPTGATPEVRVADARRGLARAASRFYGDPSLALTTVGITGTNGKTTVSFLARAVLEAGGRPTGVLGTVGAFFPGGRTTTGFTTPQAVELHALLAEMLEHGARACVLEASSHGLELERVYGVAFDVTVFTNLTHDHLDFHGTLERYLDAKLRLFDGRNGAAGAKPTIAIVHAADPHAGRVIEAARRGGQRVMTYDTRGGADVTAVHVASDASGSRFTVIDAEGRHDVELRLPGLFNVENALAAWAIGLVLGVPAEARARSLGAVTGVPGRLEPIDAGQPFAVLVDYAHTPDALARVLETVRPLARGRVHVLFGAGGDRDHAKRPEMGEVAARLADRVVLTSDNPRSEDPGAILSEILAGVPASSPAAVGIEPDRRALPRRAARRAPALERGLGVLDHEQRRRRLEVGLGHAIGPAQAGDGAVGAGLGQEAMAVGGAAGQRHEHLAGPRGARVERGADHRLAADRGQRLALRQLPLGAEGLGHLGQRPATQRLLPRLRQGRHALGPVHEALPSARRASWRSSNGSTASPMVCVVSCPLPAITTTSPGAAVSIASVIAFRRSTSCSTSSPVPARICSMIAAGSSERGLSEVTIT
jgi:UDP-N-acetylmuramoyl-L-alanyl-D-glutamate--2,6-diaminopimelate ligase